MQINIYEASKSLGELPHPENEAITTLEITYVIYNTQTKKYEKGGGIDADIAAIKRLNASLLAYKDDFNRYYPNVHRVLFDKNFPCMDGYDIVFREICNTVDILMRYYNISTYEFFQHTGKYFYQCFDYFEAIFHVYYPLRQVCVTDEREDLYPEDKARILAERPDFVYKISNTILMSCFNYINKFKYPRVMTEVKKRYSLRSPINIHVTGCNYIFSFIEKKCYVSSAQEGRRTKTKYIDYTRIHCIRRYPKMKFFINNFIVCVFQVLLINKRSWKLPRDVVTLIIADLYELSFDYSHYTTPQVIRKHVQWRPD